MKLLMIMAGGTGGHIYPAIAVAEEFKRKNWRILWLATEHGMENEIIANKDYAIAKIRIHGVRGKGLLAWVLTPFKLIFACSQAFKIIYYHRPDVVLGMGGFSALPGGLMAFLLRKPLFIHEQNAIAGWTNKILSYFSQKTFTAFEHTLVKETVVGNPVRVEILAIPSPEKRAIAEFSRDTLNILVLGGSLGAKKLNEIIPQAIALLPKEKKVQLIHQSGQIHFEALKNAYQQRNIKADCRAFITDMAASYVWADLLICRSGAMTIAELTAVGLGAVLIPYPFAVDDHQTKNGKFLVKNGSAIMIQESDLSPEGLAEFLKQLTHEQCLDMAIKARSLAKSFSAQMITNTILQYET